MELKNKIILDEIALKTKNIIEQNENENMYGIFTITVKGQIIKGKLTKDFSVETAFKETVKLTI